MRLKGIKGNLLLLIAAMIWGFAFVAQDRAASYVEPFTMNAVRSYIGALFLIPVSALLGAKKDKKLPLQTTKSGKSLLAAGVICGILLSVAVNFQQFGIAAYPPQAAASARAGFITALYVILVPVFSLFAKKRPGANVLFAAAVSVLGIYLLCLSDGIGGIYIGDIIVFACAVSFAMHIMCVDRFVGRVDGVKLSCVQFFVCGTVSAVLMFIFEKPTVQEIMSAAVPLLYLGIMSSGVAYTLQIVGQQYSDNPTVASIIMSLESFFAALGGVIFGDTLSFREAAGCAVMFAAIVLSQLPSKKRSSAAQRPADL